MRVSTMIAALVVTLALALLVEGINIHDHRLKTRDQIASSGPITRDEVLDRAQDWVNQRVPYSQSQYHMFRGRRYRMDCSGFVSMSWNLTTSLNTGSLQQLAPCTRIDDGTQALPGDAFLKPKQYNPPRGGHTMIFKRWADDTKRRMVILQEGSTATGSHETTVPYPANGFFLCRFRDIRDSANQAPRSGANL